MIDRVILPSLSLLHCNCGMAEEVWSMLRLLPYETRFVITCACNFNAIKYVLLEDI